MPPLARAGLQLLRNHRDVRHDDTGYRGDRFDVSAHGPAHLLDHRWLEREHRESGTVTRRESGTVTPPRAGPSQRLRATAACAPSQPGIAVTVEARCAKFEPWIASGARSCRRRGANGTMTSVLSSPRGGRRRSPTLPLSGRDARPSASGGVWRRRRPRVDARR